MRTETNTKGNKLAATYRQAIYIRHPGKDRMLECVCDNPGMLRRLLLAMRQKNPNRVYESDDPANP